MIVKPGLKARSFQALQAFWSMIKCYTKEIRFPIVFHILLYTIFTFFLTKFSHACLSSPPWLQNRWLDVNLYKIYCWLFTIDIILCCILICKQQKSIISYIMKVIFDILVIIFQIAFTMNLFAYSFTALHASHILRFTICSSHFS